MQTEKNRRKKYLVNEKFQMQFVWLLAAQLVIPTVIIGAFFYASNRMYLNYIKRLAGEAVISDPYIQSILSVSVLAIAVFLIVSVLLLIFLGIRFSHHVAGPMFKLERIMDRLANGEKIEPVRFRKTDTINGLSDKINAIAKKLNLLKT